MKITAALLLSIAAGAAIAQRNIQPDVRFIANNNPGRWKATISYPVFKGDTNVVSFANAELYKTAEYLLEDFLKQARQTRLASGAELEALTTASISYIGTDLISGTMSSYTFTGGAHGMTYYLPYNFGAVGGVPKRLGYSDIFKPGTESVMSDRIMTKLQLVDRAAWVHSGEVKSINAKQLNRFVITPMGVKFLFDPYELGPYSEGRFVIMMEYSEIMDLIDQAGPLRAVLDGR
jgi:hypothetical protein